MLTTRQLDQITLIGAPFWLIGTQFEVLYPFLQNSRWTGLWGFLFLCSWLAGLEKLRRLRATGHHCHGLCALWTTMVLLTLANVSNLWQIAIPNAKTPLLEVLDRGWPLSYLMMLAIGILIIYQNRVNMLNANGWRWFVPLGMGLWYPVSLWAGRTENGLWVAGLLAALLWMLPSLSVVGDPFSGTIRWFANRRSSKERQVFQSL